MLPSLKILYFNVSSYWFTGNGGQQQDFSLFVALKKLSTCYPVSSFLWPLSSGHGPWTSNINRSKRPSYKKLQKLLTLLK